MIEKLKKIDSTEFPYVDDAGVSWQSKKNYLTIQHLNFCGCGDSDSALIFIRDLLNLCNEQEWDEIENLIPVEGHRYFILYMLDHMGLTEHGGSVNYSWLTDKGEEILADIEWCLENEKEL